MPEDHSLPRPRLARDKRSLGRRGEEIAAEYLGSNGYTIVGRNWRCPSGELDIVAREGDYLVLVEVRTRRSRAYGTPEESVTPRKQAKLVEVAQTYVQATDQEDSAWRIDVIAIQLGPRGQVVRLNHIRHAVEG